MDSGGSRISRRIFPNGPDSRGDVSHVSKVCRTTAPPATMPTSKLRNEANSTQLLDHQGHGSQIRAIDWGRSRIGVEAELTVLFVPTLRVGMPSSTLRVACRAAGAAGGHSHAERG